MCLAVLDRQGDHHRTRGVTHLVKCLGSNQVVNVCSNVACFLCQLNVPDSRMLTFRAGVKLEVRANLQFVTRCHICHPSSPLSPHTWP